MEYLIHHPHELIMYLINKIFKTNESQHQCFFKSGDAEINKNQEYSNFLYTYFGADHARYISGRRSLTSTSHLFNGNVVYWCSKKKSDTSRSSSNTETIIMYTLVLDKNWIINFCRSISYPIGPPSKLYEDNQSTIKKVLEVRISP